MFETFWEQYELVDSVAIPVNCVGVMGKGLALAIKNKMPKDESQYYQFLCDTAKPGEAIMGLSDKFIYCFTKDHWGYSSRVSWIEGCLQGLMLLGKAEKTLLLPRLGCGLGGLRWEQISYLYDHYVPILGWKEVVIT